MWPYRSVATNIGTCQELKPVRSTFRARKKAPANIGIDACNRQGNTRAFHLRANSSCLKEKSYHARYPFCRSQVTKSAFVIDSTSDSRRPHNRHRHERILCDVFRTRHWLSRFVECAGLFSSKYGVIQQEAYQTY
jgi:hypothetical protein